MTKQSTKLYKTFSKSIMNKESDVFKKGSNRSKDIQEKAILIGIDL